MAARTGRPYKLQVLSTNGERKLQGDANNPTISQSSHQLLVNPPLYPARLIPKITEMYKIPLLDS